MGVQSCSKVGCDSVMCQTHIQDVGYICYPCQLEFKEFVGSLFDGPQTEQFIISELKSFMLIRKGVGTKEKITIDELFDKNTR